MSFVKSLLGAAAAGSLAATLLCMPESSSASTRTHGLVVGRLAGNLCGENAGVYAPKKKGDDSVSSDDCVLRFIDLEETRAVMRLNGANIPFRVIRKIGGYRKVHYDLSGDADKAAVAMDLRVDCPHDTEGCDYSGFLIIEAFGKSSRIHVVYYRGG